jgi:phosphoserine phosphatase
MKQAFLPEGRWAPEVKYALEGFLQAQAARTLHDARGNAPSAVLDWDNTVIAGDTADTVFFALCEMLAFRWEAPDFWDWMGEADTDGRVRAAYAAWQRADSPETRAGLRGEVIRAWYELHQRNLATAWAWDTGVFVGFTAEEALRFSREIIWRELRMPMRSQSVSGVEIPRGFRIRAEMVDLIRALGRAGLDVWILSASPRWEIETFAGLVGIAPARVIGMRHMVGADGRITAVADSPVSYGPGKLAAYWRYVDPRRPPVLVAGDSIGDWSLLDASVGVRLLVNPQDARLIEYARRRAAAGEVWLVQGAFENF